LTTTVVLDIEGTTSATEYVVETLFPYARARYGEYLSEHRGDARASTLLDDIRAQLNESDADEVRVVDALRAWTDADAKISALKTLQGWIWQEGFERGELTAHFFPDVVPALRTWHDAGITIAIYSSGSVDAQRAWFAHSPSGDLLGLVDAHFDTENAGPKREPLSYERIAAALERPPAALLFVSDMRAELDAARAAGWRTVGVRRPGEPAFAAGVGDHDEIATFDQLDLSEL
jgi:enolase-phosphatase E1